MSTFEEFTFLSHDSRTTIHVRGFLPEGPVRGCVQIAHGVAEHGARYDHFMQFLADNGYAAFVNDHLGHGHSIQTDDHLGFFSEKNGWNTVVDDMKTLRDILEQRFPDKPLILFGHSMGSFLSRTYLIRYPGDHAAAIICGTGQMSSLLVRSGKLLAKTVCCCRGSMYRSALLQNIAFGSYTKRIKDVRTSLDWISLNEENVDAYIADPLCGTVSTAGLFRDMMGGLQFNSQKSNLAKMQKDMPVLFIAGSEDPVGDYGKGVRKAASMFKESGMKRVSLKLFDGDRHEILNEADHDKVYRLILVWLGKSL